ncbi:hypothetical protein BRARA_A03711 [Brassica rapa]|uniref:Uncharacterized protein n=3 Tax=Brassica TaxID=3705 RepID=A0ABQ7WWU1_BRANA|nr:defensin-like protein 204 [Brassica napus]XP_033147705.1 defensin-like protein 204 [Brassica rapa]XP_048626178.1 defensin-like protein 204 [Brassica napus]KAH0838920.1 hypothetical protein HID58_092354 [Brassica napus]KAH0855683.1 hypothetical protein HID58_003983 [Brassica napus]RID81105.1 hypothetical protein BRARA_A03711 [Brassica rapa]CAG7890903.1 unnamed protein product [Brassica rapa]CDY18806.1 BnaAnng02710D [Brassica napus]
MAKTLNSICFATLLLVVLLMSTEIQKSEATCKKFLGEAPVHPCKEKACKEVCKEHYYHSCKGECEMHGYEEHCHCYGKY